MEHHESAEMALFFRTHGNQSILTFLPEHANRPFSAIFLFLGYHLSNGEFWGGWLIFALASLGQFFVAFWLLKLINIKGFYLHLSLAFVLASIPLWTDGLFLRFLTPQITILLWILWLAFSLRFMQIKGLQPLNIILMISFATIAILTYPAFLALMMGSILFLIYYNRTIKNTKLLAIAVVIPFVIFISSTILFSSFNTGYLSDIGISTYFDMLYQIPVLYGDFFLQDSWSILGYFVIIISLIIVLVVASLNKIVTKENLIFTISSIIISLGSILIFLPLIVVPDLFTRFSITLFPLLWLTSILLIHSLRNNYSIENKIYKIFAAIVLTFSVVFSIVNYVYLSHHSSKMEKAFNTAYSVASVHEDPTIIFTSTDRQFNIRNFQWRSNLAHYYLLTGRMNVDFYFMSSAAIEAIYDDFGLLPIEIIEDGVYVFDRIPLRSGVGWYRWLVSANSEFIDFFERNFDATIEGDST